MLGFQADWRSRAGTALCHGEPRKVRGRLLAVQDSTDCHQTAMDPTRLKRGPKRSSLVCLAANDDEPEDGHGKISGRAAGSRRVRWRAQYRTTAMAGGACSWCLSWFLPPRTDCLCARRCTRRSTEPPRMVFAACGSEALAHRRGPTRSQLISCSAIRFDHTKGDCLTHAQRLHGLNMRHASIRNSKE